MRRYLSNQNGLGLNQVIFASVVLMGISVTVFNLIELETKKLARKNKDLVVNDFYREISDSFANQTSCTNTVNYGANVATLSSFTGNNQLTLPSIKNQNDIDEYVANPANGTMMDGVRLSEISIRGYDPTMQKATALLTFNYYLSPSSKITKTKPISLSVTPDATNTKLEKCVLAGRTIEEESGDVTPPAVIINQASTQADPTVRPTVAAPIIFDIEFTEPIEPNSFANSDISFHGTAVVSSWQIENSGDDTSFTLKVTALTSSGTVMPQLMAGVVQDLAGNDNTASTSTDNSVLSQIEATLSWVDPETVQNFGSVLTDTSAILKLKNTGEVTSKQISLTALPSSWAYGTTNQCLGNTLTAGQECQIQLKLLGSTSTAGSKNFDLTASETGGGSSATISLTGSVPATTTVWVSPTLAFGDQVCDKTIQYTLKNTGANASNNLQISVTNSTFFEISENLCDNLTLAPNAECKIKVNFKGSSASTGAKTAVLSGGSYNSTLDTENLSGTITATDPCLISPSVGTKCLGCSVIYAGAIGGNDYYVTQSGCTNNADDTSTFTPTCSGSVDSVLKTWDRGNGGSSDIAALPNDPNPDPNKGNFNTDTMTALAQVHKVARYCGNMSLGGYTDWFVPNRDELSSLYQNREAIGGFQTSSSTFYWSSTERNATTAIDIDFSNGVVGNELKSNTNLVRCVRSADCYGATPPNLGTICPDGSIYAGTLDGFRYFTTRGGCTNNANDTDQFTPTCAGGTDTVKKSYNDGVFSTGPDLSPKLPITSTSCPLNSTTSPSGEYGTGIASDNGIVHKAPRYCKNMVYAGKADWFLPDIRERMMLYSNRTSIEGYVTGTTSYLSTSQRSATRIFHYLLCGSTFYDYSKINLTGQIRCLRRWNPSDPCQSKTEPSIGTTCTSGAKYAGSLTVGGVTSRYMVTPGNCTNNGQSTFAQFNTSCTGGTDTYKDKWLNKSASLSSLTNPDPSADSKSGEHNTNILGPSADYYYAAKYCHNMIYGGYSDWFLPNYEELNLLYTNRVSIGSFATTGPSPSYTDGAYWSSTYATADNAWSLRFGSGSKVSSSKLTDQYIRCVRRY